METIKHPHIYRPGEAALSVERPLSVALARGVILMVVSAMALGVIVCHAAQIRGISFRTFALWTAMVAIGAVVAFVCWLPIAITRYKRDWIALSAMLVLSIACSTLCATAHSPNTDDVFYCANAVYHLEHPDAPMSFRNFSLASRTGPNTLYFQGTSVAHEYIESAAAYWLHADFVTVYHGIAAALVGLLLPSVFFFALFCFVRNSTASAIGTLVIILSLLEMWDTIRNPGWLAFLRPSVGKAALMVLVVPWFAALTIDFFEGPGIGTWLALGVTAITAVGLSPSGIVVLPILSFCLIVAMIASGRLRITSIGAIAAYLFAQVYIVAAAAFMLTHFDDVGANSQTNIGFPTTFWGHAYFFVMTHVPSTAILFFVLIPLSLLQLSGWQRRFLVGWFVSAALFLNPLTSHWIIFHVTSPNIYWRLFYVLPFPLVAGIAAAAVFARVSPAGRRVFIQSLLAATLVILPADWLMFRKHPGSWIGRPGPNLLPDALADCRQIIAVAPPGPMLAPDLIAWVTPILTSNYPQIQFRDAAEGWIPKTDSQTVVRENAALFVAGKGGKPTDLSLLLSDDFVKSVVLSRESASSPETALVLHSAGFTRLHDIGRYIVACRP